MDQKISGVAIGNTKLKDSAQPKSDMKEMGSEESFQADIFTGSINFPLDDPADEAGEKTNDILSDMNAALGMENGDAIVLEKDRRTLSELQAIDTLHSMIGKEEGRFSFPTQERMRSLLRSARWKDRSIFRMSRKRSTLMRLLLRRRKRRMYIHRKARRNRKGQ